MLKIKFIRDVNLFFTILIVFSLTLSCSKKDLTLNELEEFYYSDDKDIIESIFNKKVKVFFSQDINDLKVKLNKIGIKKDINHRDLKQLTDYLVFKNAINSKNKNEFDKNLEYIKVSIKRFDFEVNSMKYNNKDPDLYYLAGDIISVCFEKADSLRYENEKKAKNWLNSIKYLSFLFENDKCNIHDFSEILWLKCQKPFYLIRFSELYDILNGGCPEYINIEYQEND